MCGGGYRHLLFVGHPRAVPIEVGQLPRLPRPLQKVLWPAALRRQQRSRTHSNSNSSVAVTTALVIIIVVTEFDHHRGNSLHRAARVPHKVPRHRARLPRYVEVHHPRGPWAEMGIIMVLWGGERERERGGGCPTINVEFAKRRALKGVHLAKCTVLVVRLVTMAALLVLVLCWCCVGVWRCSSSPTSTNHRRTSRGSLTATFCRTLASTTSGTVVQLQ